MSTPTQAILGAIFTLAATLVCGWPAGAVVFGCACILAYPPKPKGD